MQADARHTHVPDMHSEMPANEKAARLAWLRDLIGEWDRRDWIALALFGLAVLIMTWPLLRYFADRLPGWDRDILSAMWQNWWLKQVVFHGQPPSHSLYLFYPQGLDTTLQPRRWPGIFTWLPLSFVFGDMGAYQINAWLGLWFSAAGTYLLIRHLTGNRYAAWAGGAFFAFYPQHLEDALSQPNTGSVQWIPVFLLALVLLLEALAERPRLDRRVLALIGVAAAAGAINAYINLKIWVLAAILAALYAAGAAITKGLWRRASFWGAAGLLAAASLLLAAPIYLPYLRTDFFLDAVQQYEPAGGADLLGFVLPGKGLTPLTPIPLADALGMDFSRWREGFFYVGMTTLAASVAAFVALVRRRPRELHWFFVAGVLWALSLGTFLVINRQGYEHLHGPYALLDQNPLFQGLRNPHRFTLVFALAWAVIAGYGVDAIMGWLAARNWPMRGFGIAFGALLLLEIAIVPIRVQYYDVPDVYEGKLTLEDGAIIDLPMGRQDSKYYMYLQTVHGHPIVEGMTARTPPGTYDYIQGNPLLSRWQEGEPPACEVDVVGSAEALLADGFRYVVVHKQIIGVRTEVDAYLAYFADVTPVYDDGVVNVYELASLAAHPPCAEQ